jgi:hypothetical protein
MKPFLLIITCLLAMAGISQERYSVVITELMADPSPAVALPASEWIELKNISNVSINLLNWRIADANGQSGPLPNYILQPDSYVIVCSGSALSAMSTYGPAIAVTSFPSLDNDGEQLTLKTFNGKIIHHISYSSAWYKNELKKEGGWSLEMIDTQNPCSGENNWKASTDNSGGTPGKQNAVDAVNTDTDAPQLENAYTIGNSIIRLVFNEPLDSITAANMTNYVIDNGISITSAACLLPDFTTVELSTAAPLVLGSIYNITINNIKDCTGNTIEPFSKIRTGLPSDITISELIVNEVLFNPRTGGYDYVEVYNNSNKIADATKLYVANRNNTGAISSFLAISVEPRYILPGDYVVITENAEVLALNYLVKHPKQVFTVTALPSFSDDKGHVLLLNGQGAIIDEVPYKEDWHFKLLTNTEGMALERIDPAANSSEPTNWHSAASTAGYGTPTAINSQHKNAQVTIATITVSPAVFSPDNDGFDDIARIYYKTLAPGYLANISIFDAAGRPVKNLVRNALLGSDGYWNWDGLNDKNQPLPLGTYIVFTEIFNLQGKKQSFKTAIVLAKKLR